MTSLEALFERFRGRGELAALAEIFDRTAPGLTALGVHLVRDPVEAEDLVQATFVAAIEGAGSFQGGRRLEPWLAGILARQAARVWRQRGRALERRAEAEPALDPSFAAQERELAEALELAFERLAPREREVLRRYLDGERPLDIAASQRKSAGAVRMQVLRGLGRLRKLLPAGLHAVLPLTRLPRGIESVRAEVLAHAGGAATLAPAAIVPLSLGVFAMSTKLGAAALAVSVLVYVSVRTLSEETETTRSSEVAPLLIPSGTKVSLPRALSTPAGRERRSDASEAAPMHESAVPAPVRDGLWVVGGLLGLQGLDPTQAEIHVEAQGRALSAHGLADATYAIDVNSLGPGSLDGALLVIRATHPAWRRVRAEARIDDALRERIARGHCELAVDLDLSPRTSVVGRVAQGEPEAALLREGGVVTSNDGDDESGDSFALYPDEPGDYELLVRVPGRRLLRLEVEVEPYEINDVGTLVLADEGVAIEGRLVRAELQRGGITLTATRADVVEGDEDSWGGSGLRTGRVLHSTTEVHGDGTFRFGGLDPADYVLSLEDRLQGNRAQLAYPDRAVHAPASDVEFGSDLGLVHFRTRGAEVDPPALLLFNYASDPEMEPSRSFGRLLIVDERPIELLVDRRSEFSATAGTERALAPWRTIPAGRPAVHEEVFELDTLETARVGALAIAWEIPDELVLSDSVSAYFQGPGGTSIQDADVHARGCRFDGLDPGHYRLVVVPKARYDAGPLPSFAGTRELEVEIEAGRTTHAEVEWCLGGRARFLPEGEPRGDIDCLDAEVRDALGARCNVAFARRDDEADGMWNTFAALTLVVPSELEPNLAPGAYTLVLLDEGQELVSVPFTIVAGELVDVNVVLPD